MEATEVQLNDTVFLDGTNLVVVLNPNLSSAACQKAVNFFLRLLEQKKLEEEKQVMGVKELLQNRV